MAPPPNGSATPVPTKDLLRLLEPTPHRAIHANEFRATTIHRRRVIPNRSLGATEDAAIASGSADAPLVRREVEPWTGRKSRS
jgi:hypothetical protein